MKTINLLESMDKDTYIRFFYLHEKFKKIRRVQKINTPDFDGDVWNIPYNTSTTRSTVWLNSTDNGDYYTNTTSTNNYYYTYSNYVPENGVFTIK